MLAPVLALQKWPSGSLSDFRDTQTSLFLRCKELGLRVLTAMAVSLDLDPELFLSAHRLVGSTYATPPFCYVDVM